MPILTLRDRSIRILQNCRERQPREWQSCTQLLYSMTLPTSHHCAKYLLGYKKQIPRSRRALLNRVRAGLPHLGSDTAFMHRKPFCHHFHYSWNMHILLRYRHLQNQ
jgi:hypothetical protein